MDYRAHVQALEQAAALQAAEMSTPRLFGNAQSEFTDYQTFSVTVSLRGDHAPSQWGNFLDVFSREHFHKHAFGRERGKGKGHIHFQGMSGVNHTPSLQSAKTEYHVLHDYHRVVFTPFQYPSFFQVS